VRSAQDDLIEGLRLAAVAVLCAGVTAALVIGLGDVAMRQPDPDGASTGSRQQVADMRPAAPIRN